MKFYRDSVEGSVRGSDGDGSDGDSKGSSGDGSSSSSSSSSSDGEGGGSRCSENSNNVNSNISSDSNTNTNTNNHESGNLLFGGKKTGQYEHDFFEHGMATNLTQKISIFLSWILNLFYRYSEYPLQLGLSEFASYDQYGQVVENPQFPWCLSLQPVKNINTNNTNDNDNDTNKSSKPKPNSESYLEQICSIPANTHIYDIYGIDTPGHITHLKNPIRLLGKVITTTPFIHSKLDTQIYFKHQKKEEDYKLRPEWIENSNSINTNNNNNNNGSVSYGSIGSSYFETHVANNNFKRPEGCV